MAYHRRADSLRDVIFSYLKGWKGYIDILHFSIFASADGLLSLIFIRLQSLQEKLEHLVQIPETGFLHCNVTFWQPLSRLMQWFSRWSFWVNPMQCVVCSHRTVECIWNVEKENHQWPHVIYFSCSIKQEIWSHLRLILHPSYCWSVEDFWVFF